MKTATALYNFVAAICLLMGCAVPDSEKDDRDFQRPLHHARPPYDGYVLDDSRSPTLPSGCQTSAAEIAIRDIRLPHWLPGQGLTALSASLHNAKSGHSITNPIVRETLYDSQYLRVCDQRTASGKTCRSPNGESLGWDRVEENPLRLCRNSHLYPRHSYESVALSTVYYIEQAYQQFQRVRPDASIPPVRIEILPRFVDRRTHVTLSSGEVVDVDYYIANNLAFFPASEMIAVFPETEQKFEQAERRPHLWEVPFVVAHEFAHRIETFLIGDRISAVGLQWDPMHHHYFSSPGADDNKSLRLMWTAISEGFADLIAYYSFSYSAESLALLPGTAQDRNPGFGQFRDFQTPKVLKKSDTRLFFANQDGPNGPVNWGDPHIVGAALAHNLDAMFGVVAEAAGIGAERATVLKYEMTLDWLVGLDSEARRGKIDERSWSEGFGPVATGLEVAIQSALTKYVARDRQNTVRHAVYCRAKSHLSALSDLPFVSNTPCP